MVDNHNLLVMVYRPLTIMIMVRCCAESYTVKSQLQYITKVIARYLLHCNRDLHNDVR